MKDLEKEKSRHSQLLTGFALPRLERKSEPNTGDADKPSTRGQFKGRFKSNKVEQIRVSTSFPFMFPSPLSPSLPCSRTSMNSGSNASLWPINNLYYQPINRPCAAGEQR